MVSTLLSNSHIMILSQIQNNLIPHATKMILEYNSIIPLSIHHYV